MVSYDLNVKISVILGAWRLQTFSLWGCRSYNLYAVILMILQSIFVLSQLTAGVFGNTKDIPELLEKLAIGFVMFMNHAKLLNFVAYKQKIMGITTMLTKDPLEAKNKDEHEIKKKYKQLSK